VNTAKGLNDVKRRDTITTSLNTSLQKIESHLSQSLAGSVRIRRSTSAFCIEMLPIQAESFYTEAPLMRAGNKLEALALKIDVKGLRAVIGSTDNYALYAELTKPNSPLISSRINRQNDTENTAFSQLKLAKAQTFEQHSIQRIVRFIDGPISYCIEAGNLFRYSQYPIKSQQPLTKVLPEQEPKRVLLAQGLLASSHFQFLQNKQIVEILLSAGNTTESLSLNQQIWLAHD
jgi:hypothetical protein